MKLDDLKNGDVVILKNGERYMKVEEFLVGYESEGYITCNSYAEDMRLKSIYNDDENDSNFDITKVYRCKAYRFAIADFPDEYMIWSRDEEYAVDWSEVKVDTKVLVKDTLTEKWNRRYFAKYENGKAYTWIDGSTSWSGRDSTPWEFAKLAESEGK